MKIDIIEYIKEFESLREAWEHIYHQDPESHPCLSWQWLREYLPRGRSWFILALRRAPSDAHHSAFLPLEVTTYLDEGSGVFCDEIRMVANHGTGRAGLLCKPGLEDDATDAAAGLIGRENWARMRFHFLEPRSARLGRLLDAFSAETFVREHGDNLDSPHDGSDKPLHCVLVSTRSGRNLRNCLNRHSTDFVFERAMDLHARGELDRAEAAYRQVVRAAPRHIHARYGLAQLCCDRGEYAEAEHLYRGLLSAMPHADRVLHRLGDAQMAQALYREASETFESLIGRHPHLGIIRYKLAVCLLAAGRKQAAIATLLSFDEIASDDPDHIRCKEKAREAILRLRMLDCAAEPQAESRTPEMEPDSVPTARAISPRFMTSARLLKPSLPRGVSAHLNAASSPYGRTSSRLKH